jgi:hypothetical protein
MEGMWIHALLHWFNQEYWSVSWPNVFAPSFWTLLGIIIADIRSHRRHKNTFLERDGRIAELTRQVESLSDRLKMLIGGNDDNE